MGFEEVTNVRIKTHDVSFISMILVGNIIVEIGSRTLNICNQLQIIKILFYENKKKTLALLRKDMQILNCEEQSCYVGGDHVVVDVVRSYFGKNSIGSIYTATAYDDYGNVISQSTGYFLEPRYDPAKERISGSDTAITNGSYNVMPTTFHGRTGYYELSGVPGRSGIKIHEGNTSKDTCG